MAAHCDVSIPARRAASSTERPAGLAGLADTLAEQPAPDQAPDRTEIILSIEHHTHVLLIRVSCQANCRIALI